MNQATAASIVDAVPGGTMRVLLEENKLETRVKELAIQISADYSDKELVLVAILKGAQIFACDLFRQLTIHPSLDFMSLSRYKRSVDSTGVTITRDLEIDITDKDVLIIEDIVDTGLTLDYLIRELATRKPASIAICTLLDRPELRLADIPMCYVGFDVSEEFLVGYGLDYREKYRDLPYIAVIEEQ